MEKELNLLQKWGFKLALFPILVLMMTMLFAKTANAQTISSVTITMPEVKTGVSYGNTFKNENIRINPSSVYIDDSRFSTNDYYNYNNIAMGNDTTLHFFLKCNDGNTFADNVSVSLDGDYTDVYTWENGQECTYNYIYNDVVVDIPFKLNYTEFINFNGLRYPYVDETAEEYLDFLRSVLRGDYPITIEGIGTGEWETSIISAENQPMQNNDKFLDNQTEEYKMNLVVKCTAPHITKKEQHNGQYLWAGEYEGLNDFKNHDENILVSEDNLSIKFPLLLKPISRPASENTSDESSEKSNEPAREAQQEENQSEEVAFNPENVVNDTTGFSGDVSGVVPQGTYNFSRCISANDAVKGINNIIEKNPSQRNITMYSEKPITLNKEFLDNIRTKNITLRYFFKHKGHLYSVTFNGSRNAEQILGNAKYEGPLYVGKVLGTTRLIK